MQRQQAHNPIRISTEAGVEVNAGKVTPSPFGAGFHFSPNPLADLEIMNVKSKLLTFSTSEASKQDTSEAMYDRAVVIITKKNLSVPIDVSILYSLKKQKAPSVYGEYGIDTVWEEKLLVKKARSVIRESIGKATVYELNEKRSVYQKSIKLQLEDKLGDYINVNQVNVMDIPLPKKIKDSVEATMVEEQNAIKEKFKLAKVKTQAEIAKAKGKGQADGQRELAQTLTQDLLEWKRLENEKLRIEKWNGVEPTTKVFGSSGTLLNLKK